ncbi:SIS domain-containing protein [Burkholderia seminalis]|uniref:SIS domain-containing protein n=1 Tax=Burkholderia sp. Ed8 TaxID=3112957 RepID=UPI00158B024B|nr:SIS domain-containing protein [Burkholderia seminalis]
MPGTIRNHLGALDASVYDDSPSEAADALSLPRAITGALDSLEGDLLLERFGEHAHRILLTADSVLILACGGSHHLALLAKGWIESLAALPVSVELASEFRYRDSVARPRALVVAMSRSGDLADLLGAIEHAARMGMTNSLAICDASSTELASACTLAFEANTVIGNDLHFPQVFATELIVLYLLALALARSRRTLAAQDERNHLQTLRELPEAIDEVLALEPRIQVWAQRLASSSDMLFLGRGMHYPVAVEGALNMKEIASIHAEAFPAGELKHGPLALVSANMPVVVSAPHDRLLAKLNANLQEVSARNGKLFVFADANCDVTADANLEVMRLGRHRGPLAPVVHTVPMRLLARHAALARGSSLGNAPNSVWAVAAG